MALVMPAAKGDLLRLTAPAASAQLPLGAMPEPVVVASMGEYVIKEGECEHDLHSLSTFSFFFSTYFLIPSPASSAYFSFEFWLAFLGNCLGAFA